MSTRLSLSRLRSSEWIVAIAALLLLIVVFGVHWYRATPSAGFHVGVVRHATQNGWQSLSVLGPLAVVVGVLGLIVGLLQATRRAPALPVSATVFELLLSFALAIGLVIRLISPPSVDSAAGSGAAVDVGFGAYAGCALALVVFAGSYRSMRTDGIAEADGPGPIETVRLDVVENSEP